MPSGTFSFFPQERKTRMNPAIQKRRAQLHTNRTDNDFVNLYFILGAENYS